MDLSVCCQTTTGTDALTVLHPLQPLTPAEISQIAAIVNSDPPYGADTRFETMELCEPEKAVVRGFTRDRRSGGKRGSTFSVPLSWA